MTDKIESTHTPTPVLPVGRCNNCFWYWHEYQECPDLICPKCRTEEYLVEMPEIIRAVNEYEANQSAIKQLTKERDAEVLKNAALLGAAKAAMRHAQLLGSGQKSSFSNAEIVEIMGQAIAQAEDK